MKSNHTFQSPNIIPTMLFSAQEFNRLISWQTTLTADHLRPLLANRYGFCLSDEAGLPSLRLELAGRQLLLKTCCAFTEGGFLIGQMEPYMPVVKHTIEKGDGQYSIWVSIHPEKRRSIGKESIEELPRRQPNSIPDYCLELKASTEEEADSSAYGLRIGQLRIIGESFQLLSYTPPTMHVGAIPSLWTRCLEAQKKLEDFNQHCQRILLKTHPDSDNEEIANLYRMSDRLCNYLASCRFDLRQLEERSEPMSLIRLFANLANLMHMLLKTTAREAELLQYVWEHVSSSAGYRFERQGYRDVIAQLAALKYDHENIDGALAKIDAFIETVLPVWKTISEANQILPFVDRGVHVY